jgi:putative transposase
LANALSTVLECRRAIICRVELPKGWDALAAYPEVPHKIVTDQLSSSLPIPAAKAEIPEQENVKHVFVKASARVNNRAENSHQPRVNANAGSPKGTSFGARVVSAILNARKRSYRIADRSGSTSL